MVSIAVNAATINGAARNAVRQRQRLRARKPAFISIVLGLRHPLAEPATLVAEQRRARIVNATGSCGALSLDLPVARFMTLPASRNTCVEGAPDTCFALIGASDKPPRLCPHLSPASGAVSSRPGDGDFRRRTLSPLSVRRWALKGRKAIRP